MKILINIIAISVLALLSSCSGAKEFRLDAASDDIGTQNVTLMYYADGAVRTETASAIDGRFSYTGVISQPTYIEVYSAPGKLLGVFIAEGGDHIEARFSVLNPENITIKGNKDARLLADFIEENRQLIADNSVDALNRNIETFIRENPKRFASVALLTNYYTVKGYEPTALELTTLLPEKFRKSGATDGFEQLLGYSLAADSLSVTAVRAFSRGDSATTFTPEGARLNLLMLTDDSSRAADSLRTMLQAMRSGSPSKEALRVTDFGCDRDTMLWHTSLRALPDDYPADIVRLWLPGGYAAEGIASVSPTSTPYFILTDSVGNILFRGESASGAKAAYGQFRHLAR